MKEILVFKSSTDVTIRKLFSDLGKENIDCLIQSSQIIRFKTEYPYINFIDIHQEGFYDLPPEVIHRISSKKYEKVFVTFSGITGHNYGNVMELVSKINYKRAFFYNCNGDKVEIPKENFVKDELCRLYIKGVGFIYGLRGD